MPGDPPPRGPTDAGGDAPDTPDEPPADGGSKPEQPAPDPVESPNAGPGSVVAEPMDAAAFIYDPSVVRVYDLEIAPADLQRADSNPSNEQYVPARLRFEGTTYDVGYRYKGSVGAFGPPCTGGFNGGQPKTGKCSIKLSFNWTEPEGQFFGLRKLIFHSMNNDPSMLRERLGYSLFRAMGVPAPRATHAVLRVNGQADIYAFIEEVDGRFTRSRFTEGGKGNLYKEIWPIHADPAVYLGALETNEDQMPSVDRIVRFKDAVLAGPEAMAAWVDLDVTSSYMAVDRVIVNDDGAFNFYCIVQGIGNNPVTPGNHNYYWYEAASADRLWLIPWDLDHSMRESTMPPHVPLDWRSEPNADQCTVCGGGGGFRIFSVPPGCDRVIQNFQAWRAMYEAKIDRFIAGPFSKSLVDQNLDAWTQQIVAAGFPVQDAAISELKAMLDRARMNRGFPY